jgi:membrane protein YqaA with SNARE-associated domain
LILAWIAQAEYFGLFLISLISATLITAPSDVLAIAMVAGGHSPFAVGGVAVLGGFLGNLINYALGRWGARWAVAHKILRPPSENDVWQARAMRVYRRYGVYSLLLTGLPFIGDPLTVLAGAGEIRLLSFSVWVIIGKIVKFVIILGIATVI